MTQAVLHQLQLAVRSAEHGNVGEGTVYLPILSCWASSMSTPPVIRAISLARNTASEKSSAAWKYRTAHPEGACASSSRSSPPFLK